MDLSKLEESSISNEGAVHHVRDPKDDMPAYYKDSEGNDKPVTITVLGPDSEVYHQATMDASRKFARKKNVEPSEMEDASIRAMARCFVSWDGFFDNGKPLKLNFDQAYQTLKKHRWLRDQVREFQDDRANFFKSSEKS